MNEADTTISEDDTTIPGDDRPAPFARVTLGEGDTIIVEKVTP